MSSAFQMSSVLFKCHFLTYKKQKTYMTNKKHRFFLSFLLFFLGIMYICKIYVYTKILAKSILSNLCTKIISLIIHTCKNFSSSRSCLHFLFEFTFRTSFLIFSVLLIWNSNSIFILVRSVNVTVSVLNVLDCYGKPWLHEGTHELQQAIDLNWSIPGLLRNSAWFRSQLAGNWAPMPADPPIYKYV